jgi:hypothetical protein
MAAKGYTVTKVPFIETAVLQNRKVMLVDI